jgi:ATP-binding cassette subfamily F protein uup
VRALSGGERNRLLLARLFLEGANVLVLDEPTNDLDLVTLNVLERLLLDFDGSVLLVTHDRYFLDKVATSILAFEGDGRAVKYAGNYAMYRRLKEQAERAALEPAAGPVRPPRGAAVGPPRPAEPPPRAGKSRRLGFKEQRELEGMEAAILSAEGRKGVAEAALADPATYQQGGAAVAGWRAELEAAGAEVERLYARWQELEALKG